MSGIHVLRFCGIKIMLVNSIWLAAEVAEAKGFCPNSSDEKHRPQF